MALEGKILDRTVELKQVEGKVVEVRRVLLEGLMVMADRLQLQLMETALAAQVDFLRMELAIRLGETKKGMPM